MEGGPVHGAAEKSDVGGEGQKPQKKLERTVDRDGEPDASQERKNGEDAEAQPRGGSQRVGGSAGVHEGTLGPAPKRSPEKGQKSF